MFQSSKRFLNTFRRDQSGAVAVEFVLIGPILFTLLFGIMIVGYFIGINHSVTQLAAGAARASVAGLDSEERVELAEAYLANGSTKYPLLKQDALTTTAIADSENQPGMTVTVVYAIEDSILGIANSMLGMDMSDIEGSAYLAY